MKKNTLLASIFIFLSFSIFGQTSGTGHKKEVSISFGPAANRIKNKNVSNDDNKDIDNNNGFNIDVCYHRFFSEGAAVVVGVGYSTYKQIVYQKGLFEHFSQKDKDGNIYDEWFSSDMTYTTKISTLDIPLKLHFLLGRSKGYDLFFDLGVINQFLIAGNSEEKGSIENMGKYPESNPYFSTISQNNPYYDYKKVSYDNKYNDRFNFYNISGHVAAGLAVKMSELVFFKAQAYVNIGFSDITAKELRGKEYENIVGQTEDYEKTKLFAAGLNVGFVMRFGQK